MSDLTDAEAIRETLDRLFDEADRHPSTFKCAALGGWVLDHPELIGRTETARQKGDREHRERTKK